MEENKIIKANFNLMQSVVDKLYEISIQINKKNEVNVEKSELDFKDFFLQYEALVRKSHKNILASQQHNLEIQFKRISKIKSVDSKVVNSTKNYMLIGKDSPVKFKTFLFAISALLISWWGLKYIPNFILKNEELKETVENYSIYYNYQFLKDLKSGDEKSVKKNQSIMSKIKTSNTDFFKEDNDLVNEYNSEK